MNPYTEQPAGRIVFFPAGTTPEEALAAYRRRNARRWLREGLNAPHLLPALDELVAAGRDVYEAVDLLGEWFYGLPLDPVDELAILEAAGMGRSFRAAGLRLHIALRGLLGVFRRA